jgi:hypothetical protein
VYVTPITVTSTITITIANKHNPAKITIAITIATATHHVAFLSGQTIATGQLTFLRAAPTLQSPE